MSRAQVIRNATAEDVARCHHIERLCFPEAEAAPRSSIEKRQAQYPEGFLVLEEANEIVGFINSGATHRLDITDEAFKDMIGHDPSGREIVIFSVSIRPDRQGEGLSTPLMHAFIERARALDKANVHLLCKADLVGYYARFGFADRGLSGSEHGGAAWHMMTLPLGP